MSRRTRFLVFALFSILCISQLNQSGLIQAQEQKQPASPMPVAGPKPGPEKEKAPDYSQEALVIEQFKTSYRFEKDGTGQREINFRVRVQSEAALERLGQLVFAYTSANENLDIDFVRVLKPDGAAITSSAADIQDLSAPLAREAPIYTDLRQST